MIRRADEVARQLAERGAARPAVAAVPDAPSSDELDADDFEEVLPLRSSQRERHPVELRSYRLRTREVLSINLSHQVMVQLDGWPRFDVEYSARTHRVRIRARTDGKFEARAPAKARAHGTPTRYVLRIPLPPSLQIYGDPLEARYEFGGDGRTLYIQVPRAMHLAEAPR